MTEFTPTNFIGESGVIAHLAKSGKVTLYDGDKAIDTYPTWQDAVEKLSGNKATDAEPMSKKMLGQLSTTLGAIRYENTDTKAAGGETPAKGKKPAKGDKATAEVETADGKTETVSGTVEWLDPSDIIVGQNPCRTKGEKRPTEELAADLRDQAKLTGDALIQNIVVGMPNNRGKYPLIAGEGRVLAAMHNKTNFPNKPEFHLLRSLVVNVDKAQALAMSGAENLKRDDMTVLGKAKLFGMLNSEGMTFAAIAKKYGITPAMVTRIMKVDALPANIKGLIESGKMNQTQAIALAELKDKDEAEFKAACKAALEDAAGDGKVRSSKLKDAARSAKASKSDDEGDEDGDEDEKPARSNNTITRRTTSQWKALVENWTAAGADPNVAKILSAVEKWYIGKYDTDQKLVDYLKKFKYNG